MAIRATDGIAFEDEDVVRCYQYRAPYAPALYDHLVEIAPTTHRALDLGCGPGKLAHELVSRFDAVDAVDPSAAMLAKARERQSSVNWIHATGEDAALAGVFDLVTIGASIHWMDHGVVFPKLRAHLVDAGVLAFIDGDGGYQTPWDDAWRDMTQVWLARVGRGDDAGQFHRLMTAHESWIDLLGRKDFVFDYSMQLEHVLEREHSRQTWTRAKLGPLADEMDRDMRAVLAPHVVDDGLLHFKVQTRVMWGELRAEPRT